MQVVGVELAVRCKACATPVAINGLVPAARCDACSRAVPLLAPFWLMLFRGPLAESAAAPMNHEQSSPFTTEEGVFHFVHRHTEAPCRKCGGAIPLDAETVSRAHTAGSIACRACATTLAARPVPAGLVLPEIALVVGEDVDQVVPERGVKAEPQPLACPSCGGALQVSGEERVVTCHYCRAQATLPDEIWQRLHPIRPVHRWYVAYAAATQGTSTTATWNKLTNVVVDDEGNLCCVGRLDEGDEHASAWSFTPEGTVRWVKRDLPQTRWNRTRIVAIRGGHLAVWERGRPTILVLRASDGETTASINAPRVPEGGSRRRGPDLPKLDLDVCDALAFDRDGTILTCIDDLILRFSPAGALLPTWPETEPPERPLPGFNAPLMAKLESRPPAVCRARLLLGGDDLLYLYSSEGIAKLEHGGLLHWFRRMGTTDDSRIGVDGHGTLFLSIAEGVVRCDRFGQPKSRIARRAQGGLVGDDEEAIAVARDGTLHVLGHGGRHRRFGPDGKVAYISAASRAADDA